MTAYHGGKQFIGKKIAEVIYDISIEIEKDENFEIKGYCEPFCGMLGVYQHIPSLFKKYPQLKYKAGDINRSVILMWKESQKGWKPPTKCTEEYYNKLKYNNKDSAEKGFIGHQCAFGGIYFGSYALKYGKSPNSIKQGSNNVKKVTEKVKNVKFSYGEYTQFSNLKGYIIYCDPPYSKTFQYKKSFNNNKFWEWCDIMSKYNIVFISEYDKPKDIEADLVFSKTSKLTGNFIKKDNKSRTEKLYVI